MPRQCPPEILELFHKSIVRRQLLLEIALGVQINDHRQAVIQNHLYRVVEIRHVFLWNPVRLPSLEHRLRIHAQPHVVKSHRFDQRDILRRSPSLKMFLCIALRIVDLRKPLAQIDPML